MAIYDTQKYTRPLLAVDCIGLHGQRNTKSSITNLYVRRNMLLRACFVDVLAKKN